MPEARVTITEHPNGWPHTKATVGKMGALARAGSHTYAIRSLATRITHDVPSKDVSGELQALYRWVRDNIRYRFDPVGLEWVQSPERTLLERAGDCDDMATLLGALAASLGHRYRFTTYGPTPTSMRHVAVQVHDGSGWVSLDPVLEPRRKTTGPHQDLGLFGREAPARARRLWDAEGQLLDGPVDNRGVALWEGKLGAVRYVGVGPHRGGWPGAGRRAALARARRGGWRGFGRPRRKARLRPQQIAAILAKARAQMARAGGLHGPVTERETELWSWNSYYPSDPSRRQLPAPRVDPTYQSAGVPGGMSGVDDEPTVLVMPAGTMQGGLGYVDGLGFGFLKKIGKAIGGVAKGVVKTVAKIPGVSTIASLIPGGSMVLDVAKGLTSGGGKKPSPAISSPYAPGGALAPNVALRSDVDALRQDIKLSKTFATVRDIKRLENEVKNRNRKVDEMRRKAAVKDAVAKCKKAEREHARERVKAARAKDKKAFRARLDKLKRKIRKLKKRVAALRQAPCPTIGSKYPAGSRQRLDPKTGAFTVYAPEEASGIVSGIGCSVPGMGGLGLIRPSLTFSLSGLGASTAKLANKARKAVNRFLKQVGSPPQMRLPEIKTFQAADGGLDVDGLYGPNTRAAIAFYTGRPVDKLPPVARPYARLKVTWKPPAKAVTKKAAKAKKPPPPPAKPKVTFDAKAFAKGIAVQQAAASKPKPKPKPKLPALPADLFVGPPAPASVLAPLPADLFVGPPAPSSATLPVTSSVPYPPLPADLFVGPPAPRDPFDVPEPPSVPGYKVVGAEDVNPGLPPVGAPDVTEVTIPTDSLPRDDAGRIVVGTYGPSIVDVDKSAEAKPKGDSIAPLVIAGAVLAMLSQS